MLQLTKLQKLIEYIKLGKDTSEYEAEIETDIELKEFYRGKVAGYRSVLNMINDIYKE